MACIFLFCLSLFSSKFVSRCFFSLLLSLTHKHGFFSPPPPPLSLSLSLFWSLSLSLSVSLSTLHHVLFATTHGLSRYLLPQNHRRLSSPTKKTKKQKQKKTCSTNRKRLPAPRMFSFSKGKKRKEQTKLHDLAFLLILQTLLQPELFFLQLQCEKLPLRTSTLKFTVFLHQQNKSFKKCSTTRKGPHLPKKLAFQKKEKKRKKERKNKTWRRRPHIPSHIASAAACAFLCRCSCSGAREAALRAASRFSALLAAASRFCCSIHGDCSASRT